VRILHLVRERTWQPRGGSSVVSVNQRLLERLEAENAQLRCQSASKFDPRSASNFDPLERRVLTVALAPPELVGVAETARARIVG
jgi:hypothetical protein